MIIFNEIDGISYKGPIEIMCFFDFFNKLEIPRFICTSHPERDMSLKESCVNIHAFRQTRKSFGSIGQVTG